MSLVNPPWGRTLRKAMVSGSVASILSTVALAILGKSELDRTAAPVNGPSQWVWDRHAPFMNRFSWRYTGVGYVIHHAASIFWAVFHERYRERAAPPKNRGAVLASAMATSAVAYAVDFHVVPKRLSPGFEQRLSKEGLLIVYVTFALGLAGGAWISRRCTADRKARASFHANTHGRSMTDAAPRPGEVTEGPNVRRVRRA